MSPNNSFDFVPDDLLHQNNQRDVAGVADFDTAIALTGYGRFHARIISVCALCLLSNGLQNGLSSYVFSAAQCDLGLTSAQIGFLNVSFLIGGICSAFLWGAAADLVGRRKVLMLTLAADFCVTLGAACVSGFPGMVVCRFFNGFLIGAPGSITFNYIAEFHGPKQRTKSVCYSGAFFTTAWLLLPTLSYLILPLPDLDLKNGFYLSSWRLFLIIVSVPELVTAVWLYYTPESPKFLAERGDMERALEILRKMYAVNKRAEADSFPVTSLDVLGKGAKGGGDDVACTGRAKRMMGEMSVQLRKIFRPPIIFITVLVCCIMYCNMFGYFGLGLWLPELFMRFEQFQEQFPNVTASVKHLASLQTSPVSENATCGFNFNAKLYRSTLMTGVASLLGNLLSGWLCGRVSLKLVPLVTMLVGSLAAGALYWLRSSLQNLVVACVFQASMATANVAIGSVAVELFPTSVAAMALCMTMFVGRLGAMISNVVFGLLMDTRCEIPIFLVSIILLMGAMLCCFIPNSGDTKKSPNFSWLAPRNLHIDIVVISNDKLGN